MNMWQKIIRENIGLKAGERLLIICDKEENFSVEGEILVAPSSGGHGREPHIDAWRAAFGTAAIAHLEIQGIMDRILDKNILPDDRMALQKWSRDVARLVPAAVLAITHFSTSHTAFRRLLSAAGTRYASMPLYQPYLLRENGPLDVDQSKLIARTRRLAERLRDARNIHLTTPIGTDLRFSVEGRVFIADDGDLTKAGVFGNLPAGEVYAAPVEGSAEGRMALAPDVILTIARGRVTKIDGVTDLTGIFEKHPEYLSIAELGIGTNDKASRTDNVLEAEKILGTVHIAFGDNSSFGGTQQLPYHVDHVLFDPTLTVDGKVTDLTMIDAK